MKIQENHMIDENFSNVLDIYSKLKAKYKNTSILESLGDINEDTSRYTIIGVIAEEQLIIYGQNCMYKNFEKLIESNVNFLDVIDKFVHVQKVEGICSTPLQLGTIGYLGYEMKHYFEKLDKTLKKDYKGPDGCLVKYSVLNVIDKIEKKSYWVMKDSIDSSLINDIEDYVKKDIKIEREKFNVLGDTVSDFTKDEYINMIKKTHNYIGQGDIFQANITCRFNGKYIGDPYELYIYLRKTTPNPFFAYLDFEHPVISTSPERYFKIQDNEISSYPIKGTIECIIDGKDQKETLRNSEKDFAENVMITDLVRNDIGCVCKQGSVHVSDLCGVKRFNHIYHLESIVKGELRDNVTFSDVLQSNFPGGSITGAPKIRSMDIIEEIENTQRGPYTGAIGFFGESGYVDTSIGIRIIYFDDEKYFLHAGGGITFASDPELEYEELMTKSISLINALKEFNILKKYRDKIDEMDNIFLKTLNNRFDLIKEVGEVKRKYGISIMQSSRVDEMIDKRKELCSKYINIPEDFVEEVFKNIIEIAMTIER